jgi:RHS repeat-associated protein
LESRQTYSRPENSAGDNLGYVIVDHLDAGGALLARQRHYFHGSPRSSFDGTPVSYSKWKEGREYRTESFDANGATLLQRSDTTWQQPVDGSAWPLTQPETSDGARPNNPQITQTTTTLPDTNQVAKQTFSYDSNNNQTDVWEYDFGPGPPPAYPTRHTHTDYLTSGYDTNTDIHLRNLPSQRLVYAVNTSTGAETLASYTTYEYDLYDNSPNHAPLVDRPGISGLDGGFTTGYTTRGNVTKVSRWQDTTGGWVYTYTQCDIAGNVVKAIDGRGFAADFYFNDCFGSADDDARSNSGAPELVGGFSYAFPTRVTNALGHTAYTQYDYYLGVPVNAEDANGVVSSVAYNDTLDRPTQGIQGRYIVGVGVPAERRQTAFTYDDTNLVITKTSDLSTFADNVLTSKSYYDGLGRTWRDAAYEGATWTIKDTQFDAFGRVSQVSNPYRAADPGSASPPSGLWTTTEYDALGRVIKVATPDGAHVDTTYSGNQVTVTDQAGKKRRSETDALGRLIKVTEAPGELNYNTTYLYDALDNLRYVNQGGQERWFAYDSLSRLIRAKNPEQDVNANPNMSYTDPVTAHNGWSTAYKYDPNGNLTEKTDAGGIVTTYTYDALNRNTVTNYVNGSQTRSVENFYDGAANGKGRLHYERTKEGGVNSTETKIDSYDALGRTLNKQQSFWRGSDWGTPFVIQQTYNLAGAIRTLIYPSDRTVTYSYDQAGQLNSFTGHLGDGVNRNYAIGIQYDAAGSMKREQFGTTIPLYHRRHYNSRGQLFDIRLGTDPNPLYDSDDLEVWQDAAGSWNRGALRLYYSTLDSCHVYGNGGTNNNGNLLRMDHHIPLNDAVSNFVASIDRYDYDPLNRLKSVTEIAKGSAGENDYRGVFRQAFLYDCWGNRTIDQANTTGGTNSKAYIIDASTNRLQSPGGSGTMQYDAAGNLQRDNYTSGVSQEFIYDGENRLVEVKNGGVPVSWYVYDAEGRRVVRTVGSQGTWQVYGIGGELLAEYAIGAAPTAAQKEYGYRNGQLLMVWDGSETGDRQLQWLVQDHLGSTRMVVDRSGSLGGVRRHDFAPFGEELSAGVGIRSAAIGYGDDLTRQKFGSKERDNETGLDYFLARYYSSVQGRFTSPDEFRGGPSEVFILGSGSPTKQALPYADIFNPQSLNKYQFTYNNPLRYVDPDGHDADDADPDPQDQGGKRLNVQEQGVVKTAGAAAGCLGNPICIIISLLADPPKVGGDLDDPNSGRGPTVREAAKDEATAMAMGIILPKGIRATSGLFSGVRNKVASEIGQIVGKQVVLNDHAVGRFITRVFTEGAELSGVTIKQVGQTLKNGTFFWDTKNKSYVALGKSGEAIAFIVQKGKIVIKTIEKGTNVRAGDRFKAVDRPF